MTGLGPPLTAGIFFLILIFILQSQVTFSMTLCWFQVDSTVIRKSYTLHCVLLDIPSVQLALNIIVTILLTVFAVLCFPVTEGLLYNSICLHLNSQRGLLNPSPQWLSKRRGLTAGILHDKEESDPREMRTHLDQHQNQTLKASPGQEELLPSCPGDTCPRSNVGTCGCQASAHPLIGQVSGITGG